MAIFGIDTSKPASQHAMTLAAQRMAGGDTPKFWGRYFNGTDDKTYQYKSSENAYLRGLGIPVLCWARQMKFVGDAYASAAANHAKNNMQGVIDAFGAQYLLGQNIVPRLYLDLEPESGHPEYVMAQAYYTNWSAAIVAGLTVHGQTVKFRPAVYLNLGDNGQSFLALNAACAAGAVCDGVWPARYLPKLPPHPKPVDKTLPPPMSNLMVWDNTAPAHDPFPPGQPDQHIPKIGWQYYGDYPKTLAPDGKTIIGGDVDFNMVNPAYETLVMKGMVPPPP